ncbi:unnamed protein product [Caenorhabditis angaria]|uniref:Uncharacterized protein n=1 Tax=Caenorhabditis angaria TaxID=860376 RepID=A0A9P1J5G4_9PELO|nr:unnamed protein product [Caenorhabditis angaria]
MDNEILFMIPHASIGAFFILSVIPWIAEKFRLRFQLFAHCLLALLFFWVPTYFLKATVSGQFNTLHGFLQSFCSAVHVGHSYLLYKTLDQGKPEQSIIFSRVVTAFISLLTRSFAAWHLSEKSTRGLLITDNFLYAVVLTDGLWFLTDLFRMYRNKRTTQEEIDMMVKRTTLWVEGKGSHYVENALYFDAGLTITYAIIHFAFPQHVLRLIIKTEHTLDSHHYLWCRIFGALNLMPAISSMSAKFYSPELQVTYFASRLLTQCTVFLLNIYGHWILAVYSANHITAFMISGFFSSFLFSVFHRLFKLYFDDEEAHEPERYDEKKEKRTIKKRE